MNKTYYAGPIEAPALRHRPKTAFFLEDGDESTEPEAPKNVPNPGV